MHLKHSLGQGLLKRSKIKKTKTHKKTFFIAGQKIEQPSLIKESIP